MGRPYMARFALMADKWLASVGAEEPFVVRNCRYAIKIIGERSVAPLCGRSEGHSSLLGS